MATAGHADEAAIREQAYYLWEQDGRPEGHATEYWMRAVVAVTGEEQLHKLVEPAPKQAARAKEAASKSKAAPARAETVKKPKKK